MYSRSYYPSDDEIVVPDNYDGTAFSDSSAGRETTKIETAKNEIKFSPADEPPECEEVFKEAEEREEKRFLGIDFSRIFKGGLFKNWSLKSFLPDSFGTEELLILGIALFLIFSSSRDIECALLLIALVFIK